MSDTTKAVSTALAADYKITSEPKNLKLEVGKYYKINSGDYGTRDVKIVAMRKLDDEVIVYYSWRRATREFMSLGEEVNTSSNLNTFKMQLLDYGKLESIDLLYPTSK